MRDMKQVLVCRVGWMALLIAAIASPLVVAQSSSSETPGGLQEVIVTAQKRAQKLQDVPVSISAVTSDTLDDSGVTTVQDLAQLAPGLIFAETVGRQTTVASIRGVAPFGFADETVIVMVDGYTSGFQRSGNNATLLDLERVEILRGPQATLYGRNAIGGVINYITRKPSDELRVSLRADVGTLGSLAGQASVSGPIVEGKFFAGVALGLREFGGFLDNQFNGAKDVDDQADRNARLTLRFTPTDALEADLTVDYSKANDAAGDPSFAYADRYLPPAMGPTLLQVGAGALDFNRFTRTINQDVLGGFDRDETTGVLTISYDFERTTLTSITGSSKQETTVRTPFTRLSNAAFDFDVQWDVESLSQELRLVSRGDGPLQWLVGAYYFDNERERRLFLNFGAGPNLIQRSRDEVRNQALFADLEYRFNEQWSLRGGLRYDDEERTQTNLINNRFATFTGEELLPNVSLSYKPTDRLHLYGTVSRGYHAGGPNELGSIAAGAPPTYDPEYLTNYELGAKGSSSDNRLRYELAVFMMDWKDQQVFTAFDAFNRYVINAGKSEIRGLELSAEFQPIEELTLTGSLSWLDPEYKVFNAPLEAAPYGISANRGGTQLANSAQFAATLGAQYVRPIGGNWKLRLRGDVNHVGKRPVEFLNLFIADEYTVVDLYAGVETEHYEFGVYANNVADEDYITGGFAPSAGFPPLATLGKPAVVGLRARYRF
jgi:iron complex outermembrane receptor protein